MNFVLKGNICYNQSLTELRTISGYVVCENGISQGAFEVLPKAYQSYPIIDYQEQLILPGLCDIHTHAPQYDFRGIGMDLELLEWLNTYTFNEEAKYADLEHAKVAYARFVQELVSGATTRAVIFATMHSPATQLLMEMLEKTGLITLVGKVNMDRNSPTNLCEPSEISLPSTENWIKKATETFTRTKPIISPRFIPTCSDELMAGLGRLQKKYNLPVQSHLSESQAEIRWVKQLCPQSTSYGDAYATYGLFGGENVPTIMAHCVWTAGMEEALIKNNRVYVAHCPQSNMNLASGIAPIRRFLNRGINVGLGSDVAGGAHLSIFRAMSDAIQVSKLHYKMINQADQPLTVNEALYLATQGGGSFFGKVGSFDPGYEFDAIVIDDSDLETSKTLTTTERLERIIYLGQNHHIRAKYTKGQLIAK